MAVTQDDLRSVIRELLAEELAAIQGEAAAPPPAVRAEEVSIDTNDALGAFVKRILELAADDKARAEIEQGRHVFRLAPGARVAAPSARSAPKAAPARYERGLVTEKDIAKLPAGIAAIEAGKRVRFTPLARDELRRRGIKIERTRS